jgi:hypothetical protein
MQKKPKQTVDVKGADLSETPKELNRATKIAAITNMKVDYSSKDWIVRAISWQNLNKLPNLADYDILLFDMSTRPSGKEMDSAQFGNKLNFRTFLDVTAHGGQVLILGDPDFSLKIKGSPHSMDWSVPFLSWTGLQFRWSHEIGDTVEILAEESNYRTFLGSLRSYELAMKDVDVYEPTIRSEFGSNFQQQFDCKILTSKLAVNRHNQALSSVVCLKLLERQPPSVFPKSSVDRSSEAVKEVLIGPLIFLPVIGGKTIVDLLAELFDIKLTVVVPDWAAAIVPVNQVEIDSKIESLDEEIKGLQDRREQCELRRLQLRECVRLLFDNGTSLEAIVHDSFRELGADVELPIEPNKEDGWIRVNLGGEKTLEAVLEIKSTERDSFGESGIRQLNEWKTRGTLPPRLKSYKGILIGSNSINEQPANRSVGLSDSLKKSAELNDLALLKCEDLYLVLMLHRLGMLALSDFWSELFATKGIFDATKYHADFQSGTGTALYDRKSKNN